MKDKEDFPQSGEEWRAFCTEALKEAQASGLLRRSGAGTFAPGKDGSVPDGYQEKTGSCG